MSGSRFNLVPFQDPKEISSVSKKVRTKKYLEHHGVVTPKTLAFIPANGVNVNAVLPGDLLDGIPDRFVIKPDPGAMGVDVIILSREGGQYLEPDGTVYPGEKVLSKTAWIVKANKGLLIEERVEPHPELAALSPYGTMPDCRFYCMGNKVLFAMMRLPTKRSRGYGNLARGAFPIVSGPDGVTYHSPNFTGSRDSTVHPDTGVDFNGKKMPLWDAMLPQVLRVPPLFNSPFVCVDGTLDSAGRFVVPEITLVPSFTTFLGWDYLLSEFKANGKKQVNIPIYEFFKLQNL